jgi:1-acyl-sn-glycerol-3-phosphate acyltransferase
VSQLPYTDTLYRTTLQPVSWFDRTFPTFTFYRRFLALIFKASANAKRGEYDDTDYCQSNYDILRALERVGVHCEITGIEHVAQLQTPCVVVGNHTSILETVVLPGIVRPLQRVVFVVKQSLLEYPVFKHILRTRDPIAVSRTNPRQDLKAVLREGTDRLERGRSIIVFPQTTRTLELDPNRFSTLGIKLARRAGVPVVPLALMTDAWGNGKLLKDFGKIDPSKAVRFAFGEPMWIHGRGTDEHQAVIEFIDRNLQAWKQGPLPGRERG